MADSKLPDEDWELRLFYRVGSSISIDFWQRFEQCKYLVRIRCWLFTAETQNQEISIFPHNSDSALIGYWPVPLCFFNVKDEKEKAIVMRRGKTDATEERTDWYLNIGDAVGLKARGTQGHRKPTGNIIELKVRATVGKKVEEGAQKPAVAWFLKFIEQWPKRELSERFLYKSVPPFSTKPPRESTRYRDIGMDDSSTSSADSEGELEDRPCWKWKILKRRFEACRLDKGVSLEQLLAAGLVVPAEGSPRISTDSPREDQLQTISVEKKRQMVHFKSVGVDLLVGKKKKRVKRVEVTELALGVAGSDGSSTPRQLPDRWVSICIEGQHAVPCAKLLFNLCPELAFVESPDLYFGGYPGFIQHALGTTPSGANTPV